ncbi:MAG TPA: hypothetical protein VGM32_24385 [Rhodopila sp.]|jgi:hypothetical protein
MPINIMSSTFLEIIVALLMPYFADAARDADDARREIIAALAAYATRTHAEMLRAAQIIAFSMTTLETLKEARTADMSMAMRLRHRSCANGLNRATLQAEKSLDRSLASEAPAPAPPISEPVSNSHASEGIRPKMANLGNHPAAQPPTSAERNKRLWAGAMIDTLQQMGVPTQPPSHQAT